MDCTNYNDEKCPKALTLNTEINKNNLQLLFVGCWGVYCREGEQDVIKYKKKGFTEPEKGIFGGRSVADGMSDFSRKNNVDAVILAGDNIYARNPTEYEIQNHLSIPNLKDDLNDMDLQFDQGFLKCMNEVQTKNFYLAIGNHDIVNCNILNKQLNFKQGNWNLPGLYYNVIYNVKGMYKVNLIFIDTNIYDKQKTCNPKEYSHDEDDVSPEQKIWLSNIKNTQKEWLRNVIKTNNCEWNIIIGHIPFINNPHKKIKKSNFDYAFNDELMNDIYEIRNDVRMSKLDIQLYLCADEHNQQFIKCPKDYLDMKDLPSIVISGSGGTDLDDFLPSSTLGACTMVGQKSHGFVSLNITNNVINITYYESHNMTSKPYKTINIDLNSNII